MAEMDKRADATKAFYAALSPEQKNVFDQATCMVTAAAITTTPECIA